MKIADFLGTYALTRMIIDARTDQQIQFEGLAKILPAAGNALDQGQGHSAAYYETGHLIMPNAAPMHGERCYLWREAAGRIHVDFDDGRPFHDFDAVAGGAAREHICGDDTYRGTYDFSAWPNWRLSWHVTGPRKSYRSVTDLHRR